MKKLSNLFILAFLWLLVLSFILDKPQQRTETPVKSAKVERSFIHQ
ncbi:MAG: hypothetical protein MI810_18145 [Flavobacteriales bacterium]|nr:hypothetical protein [Flavobacteriales bacterium]